jgi:hypothetical protein
MCISKAYKSAMKDEAILFWYRENRFTADDVTRATGLSEAAQRLLLKIGILQAVPQARTKQRLLDGHMVKRAALIAPLNKNGLSLQVAGKIVSAALMLEDFYFDLVDPWDAVFDAGGKFDRATGLFPRRAPLRKCDKWIEPNATKVAEALDYRISIVDSRFVVIGDLGVSGELTPDLTDFVWWDNAMYDHVKGRVKDGVLRLSVRGTHDHVPAPFGSFDTTDDPKTIGFKIKSPTSDDEKEAEKVKENPVSVLAINASLSLRIALRRLLYIDGPAPNQKPFASQAFLDKYYAGGPAAARADGGKRGHK